MIDVSNIARTLAPMARGCKAFGSDFPTHLELALHRACKRFPGGITAAAKLIEIDADVLQKKLSPTCETHHLTADEAERLTLATQDPAGAIELARAAGLACVPMPRAADGSITQGMSDIAQSFSRVLAEFADATRDNAISPNECVRFERAITEHFIRCSTEIQRMRAIAESREPVVDVPQKKFGLMGRPTDDSYSSNRLSATAARPK